MTVHARCCPWSFTHLVVMSQNNQIEVNLFVYTFYSSGNESVANSPSCQVRSWGSGQSNVTLEPAQSTTTSLEVSWYPEECQQLSQLSSQGFIQAGVLLPSLLSLGCRHSTDDSPTGTVMCMSKVRMLSSLHMPSTQNYPLCQEEGWI